MHHSHQTLFGIEKTYFKCYCIIMFTFTIVSFFVVALAAKTYAETKGTLQQESPNTVLLGKKVSDENETEIKQTSSQEKTFVTPEMFGAAGDGVTDDSNAIQKAIDSGYPVLLSQKTYLIGSTLTVSGKKTIIDAGSFLYYTGVEFAIRFTSIDNSCNVSLGGIMALNGSGIEFYCNSRESRCQYINLSFNAIASKNYCIYFNRDGDGDTIESGWLNEIRINDGRFQAGRYGVYADAKGYNGINNIKFINVAFEGVEVGAHMANKCRGWSFVNVRIAEVVAEGQRTFETEGPMIGLNIISNDRFKLGRVQFSPETQGAVIAPIQGMDINTQNVTVIGNIGEIIDGIIYPYNEAMASLERFIELADSTDLNLIIKPGNYSCRTSSSAKTLLNSPTDSEFTMVVKYANGTPAYITQEIWPINVNLSYKRTYTKSSNHFSPWERSMNEDDYANLLNEIDDLRAQIASLTGAASKG